MCQYCSFADREAWSALLQYDDVYQTAITPDSDSTYGFHESWDDLREEVEFGA